MIKQKHGYILLIVLIALSFGLFITLSGTSAYLNKTQYFDTLKKVYDQKATELWIVYTNENDLRASE